MNPILEFFADRQDLMFLTLVVLEITVIGCLALLAIKLTSRDAATRYGLGLCGLILIALAGPATWFVQNSSWTSFGWERKFVIDPSYVPIEAPQAAAQPVPLWMWVWGVGAGLVLARIGLGFIRVHMLRQGSIQLEKLSSDVAVYATDDAGPAVVGALRPAVLMPRKLLDSLSDEEIHDVLAHEFAHVAHKHLIVALFQRILAAVYWPHPLIHLLNRELITAREEICDNAVLRSAGATRYARVLLRVAECRLQPRHFSASLGLFGPSTSLEKRVKSLLDPNRRIESNMNKRKIVVACTALTLGMATVAGARVQTHVIVLAQESSYPVPAVVIERVAAKKSVKVKKQKTQKSKPAKAAPAKVAKPAIFAKPSLVIDPVAPVPPVPAVTAPLQSPAMLVPTAPRTIAVAPISSVSGVPAVASPSPTAPVQGTKGSKAPPTYKVYGVATPFQAAPRYTSQRAYEVGFQALPAKKATSPTLFSGKGVSGQAFFGKGVKTGSPSLPGQFIYRVAGAKAPEQRVDDTQIYRNMRGEDRPDLLTHPLRSGTSVEPAQTRALGLKSRLNNLATTKALQSRVGQILPLTRSKVERFFPSRLMTTPTTDLKINKANLDRAVTNYRLALPSDQKVTVKSKLDTTVEYRLKFNKETGKWEVIPPSK